VIRPSIVLAGWAAMLALLALVLLAWTPPQYDWLLLGGAAVGLAPIGLIVLVPGARSDQARAVPTSSLPTVVVAVGLVVGVLGIAAGPWLVLIGAELVALGGFGLVRELRAQRRASRS